MSGPNSPAEVITLLGKAGVDFSVPVTDLTDWLGNPEFTPYPAIAQSLLAHLTGRRLEQPVYIDVIVSNYEDTPGVASPRKLQDVRADVLETAVVTGYNGRYGTSIDTFEDLVVPLDVPPVVTPVPGLAIEGVTKVDDNGVILVDTDNPELTTTFRLTTVHQDSTNQMVPQELSRQSLGWTFTNGDAVYSLGGGDEDAKNLPTRGGSLNDDAYAWPATEGTFSGATADLCTVKGRIRVGYKPLTGRLLIAGPKGFAPNTGPTFRVALDPEVLLVPIEVVRFFSTNVPIADITAAGQMNLWDQVPAINAAGDTKITNGSGELTAAVRVWDSYPQTVPDEAQPRGLYEADGWVCPDSIWSKAKVRFRLVNYFEIPTDDDHVNPKPGVGGDGSSLLRENHQTLSKDPRHIADKRVVTVIYMFRIGPPDAPEVGRALEGLGAVGIASGAVDDKFAVIAHEIGHLFLGSGHSTEPNNVMNNPGPGTDLTDAQITAARSWAAGFSEFWTHP